MLLLVLVDLVVCQVFSWWVMEFSDLLVDDVFLVIVVIEDEVFNQWVFVVVNVCYWLVNVVDNQVLCLFVFFFIVDCLLLLVVIFFSGKVLVLLCILCEKIEVLLLMNFGWLVELVSYWCNYLKICLMIIEVCCCFWECVFIGCFVSLMVVGNFVEVEKVLQDELDKFECEMGEIILVGVGLGDVGLLIFCGLQVIQQVDVVFYDYLVIQLVFELVCCDVEFICVGKCVGEYLVLQYEINQLLVEVVKVGKIVVCLKGGDLFIFGCGVEELQVVVEVGILFQVVLGVIVVVGVMVYVGILLIYCDYV